MTEKIQKKKKPHYVDKAEMYQAFINWNAEIKSCRSLNLPDPPLPNFIAECFVKIANKHINNARFSRYPFREDMIADAIYFCVKGAKVFDPNKSKEPFSYFTQTCENAFWQRRDKEKHQELIKDTSKYEGLPYTEGQDNNNLVNVEALRSFNDQIRTEE